MVQTDETVKEIVKVCYKLPIATKQHLEQEAKLAYQYGWIKKPTMTQLLIWMIDDVIYNHMKNYILSRRKEMRGEIESKSMTGQNTQQG